MQIVRMFASTSSIDGLSSLNALYTPTLPKYQPILAKEIPIEENAYYVMKR